MAQGEQDHVIFDRAQVRAHRERAAPGFHGGRDFLVSEVGERLVGRLADVKRTFHRVLDLGCHTGQLAPLLRERGDPDLLVEADLSPAMVVRAAGTARVAADEEWLPFGDASLDLVVSALSLHWVNDLPGALVQIARALKPDGLLLAAMLGGDTLFELREAFLQAEAAQEGGVRPHVSPFADVRDLGGLLQRAGFALPVVDADRITVTYENAFALMRELRAMGEANAATGRANYFTRRETLHAVAACYQDLFGQPDGRIPATFQVLYLTGWRPHESQQQPARRGSGRASIAEAVESGTEPSADDSH
jgi:malonyl-ACP O-methyltransferase BioC